MSADAADILERALSLPDAERAALADSLLDSLDPTVEEGAAEAWRQEVNRRVAELECGSVSALPWSDMRARLTAALRDGR
jgi:putative addiction module component (TIGR02574 family)